MDWNNYLEEIRNKYPNAFCKYVRFFNPQLSKLSNTNLLISTVGNHPSDFDQLNEFFNAQGVYLDIISSCDTNDNVSFYYRIRKCEQHTLRTVHRTTKASGDKKSGVHCQLLWEAVNSSFATIEIMLIDKLVVLYS